MAGMTWSIKSLPAFLVIILFAGCGGGSDAPKGPTYDPATLNACELFTVRDALSFAGEPVSSMRSTLDEASVSPNPLVCSFNAGSRARPRLFGLEIRPAASPRAAARRLESSRSYLKRLSGGEIQEVPGIGDKAMFAGGELHQLHVLRGNLVLVISAKTDNSPKSLYIAKQIARRVLARLEGGTDSSP